METNLKLKETENYIRCKTDLMPEVGIILGSGLGGLAESSVQDAVFNFNELPNFVSSTVAGHAGRLILGTVCEKAAVVMQGRLHYYEGYSMEEIVYPVRLLKNLGVKYLIITSACGALNTEYRLYDIILLKDHINLMGANPLRGSHNHSFGEMFPDMSEVYSIELRKKARAAALKEKIKTKEGVYLAVSGPTYETPAEIKAFRKLGGDLAGMSVVPEAVTAKQMGMQVLGISYVSNTVKRAAGQPLLHKDVVKAGAAVSEKIGKIISGVISGL